MKLLSYSVSFLFISLLIRNTNTDEGMFPIHIYDILGKFNSELAIGKEATMLLFLEIDLQREFSWADHHYYNISSSITIKQVDKEPMKIKVIDKEEIAIIYEDYIKLISYNLNNKGSMIDKKDYIIEGYRFMYLPESGYVNHQSISFSYKSYENNEQFSLISLLYKQKYINKRQFSISKGEISYKNIHLGGIPKNLTDNKYSAKCKIDLNRKSWGCKFSYLYMENFPQKIFSLPTLNYINFQANSNKIKVPSSLFDFFSQEVFSSYLSSKQCTEDNLGNYRRISCKCEYIESLPHIIIVIENIKIILNNEALFENPIGICSFLLDVNRDEDSESSITIGSSIFNNYNLLFDYDDNSITFYSNNKFEFIGNSLINSKIKVIINITQVIIILWLILLLYNTNIILRK